eukprot:GABV01001762.1.p1 GENE.GABV01001762.1~~GABV01001762.1.p1  ORF type:complete len:117 (-),score=15.64 GABV01001762.1:456-806(-)
MVDSKASEATSQIEVFLSVSDLADFDRIGKSDPFAVVFFRTHQGWAEIGRTETIQDRDLSVSFSKQFVFDYYLKTHATIVLICTIEMPNRKICPNTIFWAPCRLCWQTWSVLQAKH